MKSLIRLEAEKKYPYTFTDETPLEIWCDGFIKGRGENFSKKELVIALRLFWEKSGYKVINPGRGNSKGTENGNKNKLISKIIKQIKDERNQYNISKK